MKSGDGSSSHSSVAVADGAVGAMGEFPHGDEVTLDPASPEEWDAFRALARRMVDDMVDYLSTVRDRAVWQPMPEAVRESFNEPLPRKGAGARAAYDDFLERVRPYPVGNLHPRFWGWVMGTGTPLGMMSDMLAAGMNANIGGFNQAPARVEAQVIQWLTTLMGMPEGSSGVLVNGCTMANLIGLAVARFAKAGFDVRAEGLQGAGKPRLVFYGSTETHNWARKSAELEGLGSDAFREVPVKRDYTIDLDALRVQIARDRAAGLRPFCVIGNAGTVNTGATDDLVGLADICVAEDLWFHVDGAFGAHAYLSPTMRSTVAGMQRADSLGFDLHKWMSLPIGVACVLVADAETHRRAFTSVPAYLRPTTRGIAAGGQPFANLGSDLTRSFAALKVWLALKAHGADRFAALVDQNVAQCRYLARRVHEHPHLELLAPMALNVVCYRYVPPTVPAGVAREEWLNALNEEILVQLQEGGIAAPSGTMLRGRFAIRVANVNQRSRMRDFDVLIGETLRLGEAISVAMDS